MKPALVTPAQVIGAIKLFIDDVEHGRFASGDVLDLAPRLVTGGIPNSDVKVSIGPART